MAAMLSDEGPPLVFDLEEAKLKARESLMAGMLSDEDQESAMPLDEPPPVGSGVAPEENYNATEGLDDDDEWATSVLDDLFFGKLRPSSSATVAAQLLMGMASPVRKDSLAIMGHRANRRSQSVRVDSISCGRCSTAWDCRRCASAPAILQDGRRAPQREYYQKAAAFGDALCPPSAHSASAHSAPSAPAPSSLSLHSTSQPDTDDDVMSRKSGRSSGRRPSKASAPPVGLRRSPTAVDSRTAAAAIQRRSEVPGLNMLSVQMGDDDDDTDRVSGNPEQSGNTGKAEKLDDVIPGSESAHSMAAVPRLDLFAIAKSDAVRKDVHADSGSGVDRIVHRPPARGTLGFATRSFMDGGANATLSSAPISRKHSKESASAGIGATDHGLFARDGRTVSGAASALLLAHSASAPALSFDNRSPKVPRDGKGALPALAGRRTPLSQARSSASRLGTSPKFPMGAPFAEDLFAGTPSVQGPMMHGAPAAKMLRVGTSMPPVLPPMKQAARGREGARMTTAPASFGAAAGATPTRSSTTAEPRCRPPHAVGGARLKSSAAKRQGSASQLGISKLVSHLHGHFHQHYHVVLGDQEQKSAAPSLKVLLPPT